MVKEVFKIAVKLPSGKTSTNYYSVEDGLKVREVSTGSMQGTVVTSFKSYQNISGVMWPSAHGTKHGAAKLRHQH
jgi:zinc protease